MKSTIAVSSGSQPGGIHIIFGPRRNGHRSWLRQYVCPEILICFYLITLTPESVSSITDDPVPMIYVGVKNGSAFSERYYDDAVELQSSIRSSSVGRLHPFSVRDHDC